MGDDKDSNLEGLPITALRVQNFKNILDSGEVPLNKITALMGKNESGKTAFLEALSSFDKDYVYHDQVISNYAKSDEKENLPIITLTFEVEDVAKALYQNDSGKLKGSGESARFSITKYADGSFELNADETVESIYDEFQSYIYTAAELAEQVESHIDGWDSDGKRNRRSAQIQNIKKEPLEPLNPAHVNRLLFNGIQPFLADFEDPDDLSDDLEGVVSEFRRLSSCIPSTFYPIFPDLSYHKDYDVISDSAELEEIETNDKRVFGNLLSIGDLTVDSIRHKTGFEQDNELNRAARTVSEAINIFWTQKDIDIDLRLDGEELRIYVINRSEEGNSLIPPSERSRGFRWFLSFYINITASLQNQENRRKAFLLDEPGAHLHPKGKRDWLSTVEEISEDHQVIYTSHSPYLIRKEYPSRIRTIEEKDSRGAEVRTDVFRSSEDTFEPLRNSLGIGYGDSPFVSKRQIIVEGPADYYILAGVATYYRDSLKQSILDWDEVSITPAGGASQVPDKAVWFASEEITYVMLLDSDEKGREVAEEIRTQYHRLENGEENTILLSSNFAENNVTIEDMFSPNFYVDCLNDVYHDLVDDFEEIEVESLEESLWSIDGYDYAGELLTETLEQCLEDQGIDQELAKVQIADEIKQRLDHGEVEEEDVSSFRTLLGELRQRTDVRE